MVVFNHFQKLWIGKFYSLSAFLENLFGGSGSVFLVYPFAEKKLLALLHYITTVTLRSAILFGPPCCVIFTTNKVAVLYFAYRINPWASDATNFSILIRIILAICSLLSTSDKLIDTIQRGLIKQFFKPSSNLQIFNNITKFWI